MREKERKKSAWALAPSQDSFLGPFRWKWATELLRPPRYKGETMPEKKFLPSPRFGLW